MSTGPRDRSFMVGSVGAKNAGGGRVSEITTAAPIDWRDQIFVVLKAAGIRQVGYVPDAGHARLIELQALTSRAWPRRRGIGWREFLLHSARYPDGVAPDAGLCNRSAAIALKARLAYSRAKSAKSRRLE
jgi:hypothetical protein